MCRIKFFPFCVVLLFEFVVFTGCSPALSAQEDSVTVFVSILPQVDFVQRVGSHQVRVVPLVLPGQSPATYAPTPQQLAALSGADLYFRIGVPFENSLIPKLKRTLPRLKVIDLRSGITLIREEDGHADNMDPHIWLDPVRVSRMALTIRDALIGIDAEHAEMYRENCAKFQDELKQLDQQLRQTLQPLAQQVIYVFHPAYAYFCQAYDLIQRPVAPAGKAPGARYLVHLIEQARQDHVQFIFVQPQFSRKTAQVIADSIGATLIPLDPLAEDYFANMSDMGSSLAAALDPDNLER